MKLWKNADGENGIRYCMENQKGVLVEISTWGAAVTKIVVPDKNQNRKNVCLRLAEAADYRRDGLYAGATVAPAAGRIGGGSFAIDGKTYSVTQNEGTNCLHGGRENASFREWSLLQTAELADRATVAMILHMEDGVDGFPGNRTFFACYTLDEQSRLSVAYKAISDKDTYVNMTNHTYFNFDGDFSRPATNQVLSVAADSYLENGENHLPGKRVPVKGTCMDFSRSRRLSDVLAQREDGGIDHAFDVRKAAREGKRIAELFSLTSGCGVRIKSPTAQCVVVYTGGGIGIDWKLEGQDGPVMSSDGCAVALECQAFPNAVNRPDLKPEILRAGGEYHHEIVYEFLF